MSFWVQGKGYCVAWHVNTTLMLRNSRTIFNSELLILNELFLLTVEHPTLSILATLFNESPLCD